MQCELSCVLCRLAFPDGQGGDSGRRNFFRLQSTAFDWGKGELLSTNSRAFLDMRERWCRKNLLQGFYESKKNLACLCDKYGIARIRLARK